MWLFSLITLSYTEAFETFFWNDVVLKSKFRNQIWFLSMSDSEAFRIIRRRSHFRMLFLIFLLPFTSIADDDLPNREATPSLAASILFSSANNMMPIKVTSIGTTEPTMVIRVHRFQGAP